MNEFYKPLPAVEDLWELFSYSPLTGNLHWREDRSRTKKGTKAGHSHPDRRYVRVRINSLEYVAHRLVWCWLYNEDPGQRPLDHIDGNVYANQPWNLRLATEVQNRWNSKTRVDNTSGYKGVSKNKTRWAAQIRKDGKRYHLGHFNTPEEAHRAYCEAAHRLHGDFARPE